VRRRDLVALLCSAATGWPFAAGAQQKATRVIGFLSGVSPDRYQPFVAALLSGLNDTGYSEGTNLAIEYRWAEDHPDRLPALTEDLVRRDVEVIVAGGGSPGVAKAATATIPIVFLVAVDPVQAGLVESFNRPGGNLTGISFLTGELLPKRLELLHELVPDVTRIAMLVNPGTRGNAGLTEAAKDAAATMGLQLPVLEARAPRDFEPAFSKLVELEAGALLVSTDPMFTERRGELVALAARHAVAASYAWREFVVAGGLISYGASIAGAYRQAGVYTGINGQKPADLPVVQPAIIELVVNLKTAKELGLTIPSSILARADEVLE